MFFNELLNTLRTIPESIVFIDVAWFASWCCLNVLSRPSDCVTSMSSSRGEMSDQSVGKRKRASGAWCLMPTRCKILTSYFINQSRHRASWVVASARFNIQRRASWSVCNVNCTPSEYCRRKSIGHTTARYSRWVVPRYLTTYRPRPISSRYVFVISLLLHQNAYDLPIAGLSV